MIEIIPAILTKEYHDLKNKISLVRGLAPVVQIDVCDGKFVSSTSWPFDDTDYDVHFKAILRGEEGLPFWEDVDFELDLMVIDAKENFDMYLSLGPRRIIFHLESFLDFEEFKDFLEGIDTYVREATEIGVAIGVGTKVEQIFPIINSIDFVQLMGIETIGLQGQDLKDEVLEKIEILKAEFPELPVSIDGGVNLSNAKSLISAGADRLVSGSAIFNTDDIIKKLDEFRSL